MDKKLILGAALAASTALAGPAFAAKDTLVIAQSQMPNNFHPLLESMLAKSLIQYATNRPVTYLDASWDIICGLCTELPTLENGLAEIVDVPAELKAQAGTDFDKGIKMTIKIQPEAVWGDGTPITADDAVFTWNWVKQDASGSPSAAGFRELWVEKVDDKTFTVTTDRMSFSYNNLGAFQLIPKHIEEPLTGDLAKYQTANTYDVDPTNPGLYWGPYRVSAFEAGSHITLVPNEKWWGKAPHFKEVTFRIVGNTAAMEQSLLAGDVDYVSGELGFSLDEALAFEKRHGSDYDIVYEPGLVYEHMVANFEHPVLKELPVRQALMYAMDRQTLVDKLFEGKNTVAHGNVHPRDPGYSENVTKYEYDPEKAKAILEEAGWVDTDGDGIREKNGQKLSFRYQTTAGMAVRELVQQVLQSQWREVGAEAIIANAPAGEVFKEIRERKHDLGMFAFSTSPENVPETIYHTKYITTEANGYSGQNWAGYSNPEMDKLLDEIVTKMTLEERLPLWERIQQIVADDLVILPLYYRANGYVFPKWLKGITPTGHQYYSTLHIEDWHAVD